jgi:hypothetical protein
MAFTDESVTGFFSAGGILRGSVVYVTSERIRVNRRRVKPLFKTHVLTALFALLGLAASVFEPWLLIITVLIVIVARLWERKASRERRPSISQIERGPFQFEVRKGQLLMIELKPPRTLRYGHIKIVPRMGEPIVLSIASNRHFVTVRNILAEFEPSRIRAEQTP